MREVYANEFQATSPELGAFTGALIGISKAIVVFKLSVILVKSNFSAVTSVISAGGVVDQLGLLHPAGNGVGLDPAISSRQGLSTVVYDTTTPGILGIGAARLGLHSENRWLLSLSICLSLTCGSMSMTVILSRGVLLGLVIVIL